MSTKYSLFESLDYPYLTVTLAHLPLQSPKTVMSPSPKHIFYCNSIIFSLKVFCISLTSFNIMSEPLSLDRGILKTDQA